MSGLVIDLRAVRNAFDELERLGAPEFKREAIACVIADVREGRSGFALSQQLWAERMRRTSSTEASSYVR